MPGRAIEPGAAPQYGSIVSLLIRGSWKTFMDAVSTLESGTLGDLSLPRLVCIGVEKSGKSTNM